MVINAPMSAVCSCALTLVIDCKCVLGYDRQTGRLTERQTDTQTERETYMTALPEGQSSSLVGYSQIKPEKR